MVAVAVFAHMEHGFGIPACGKRRCSRKKPSPGAFSDTLALRYKGAQDGRFFGFEAAQRDIARVQLALVYSTPLPPPARRFCGT